MPLLSLHPYLKWWYMPAARHEMEMIKCVDCKSDGVCFLFNTQHLKKNTTLEFS